MLGRVEQGAILAPLTRALKPVRLSLALGQRQLLGPVWGNWGAGGPEAVLLTLTPSGLRTLVCWTSQPNTTT